MARRICVNVEFFASIRDKTQKNHESMVLADGSSLQNLYDALDEKYPSAFALSMNEFVFVVNNKKADPKKILLLHDKDSISIFPFVGGG